MNLNKLKGHIPQEVIKELLPVMNLFKINTPLRMAHFLAQCAHESMNFRVTGENLYYTDAKRVAVIFRKFDKNKDGKVCAKEIAFAQGYTRNPQKLASFVYADRMGNGGEETGEGWKFRGRGYIQLTGKNNYYAFGRAIGVDLLSNPDLVISTYPLLSAAWFFSANNLNPIADKGYTDGVVTQITRRVNGGTHGLKDRIGKFKVFYNLLK